MPATFAMSTRKPGKAKAAPAPEPAHLAAWRATLARADRARCCSAKPRTVVGLPAAGNGAKPVDLLLCAHQFRASKARLAAAGAAMYLARTW